MVFLENIKFTFVVQWRVRKDVASKKEWLDQSQNVGEENQQQTNWSEQNQWLELYPKEMADSVMNAQRAVLTEI